MLVGSLPTKISFSSHNFFLSALDLHLCMDTWADVVTHPKR